MEKSSYFVNLLLENHLARNDETKVEFFSGSVDVSVFKLDPRGSIGPKWGILH